MAEVVKDFGESQRMMEKDSANAHKQGRCGLLCSGPLVVNLVSLI